MVGKNKGVLRGGNAYSYEPDITARYCFCCFSKYYLDKKKSIDINKGRLFLEKSSKFLEEYKNTNL